MKSRVQAIAIIAAALAAPGFAMAQSTSAAQSQSQPSAPWYERFTFGTQRGEGANAWVPRSEAKSTLRLSPQSNWGVTFGLDDQRRLPTTAGTDQRRASAGAFYELRPGFRVGGSVELPTNSETRRQQRSEAVQRTPSVKIESAFKF